MLLCDAPPLPDAELFGLEARFGTCLQVHVSGDVVGAEQLQQFCDQQGVGMTAEQKSKRDQQALALSRRRRRQSLQKRRSSVVSTREDSGGGVTMQQEEEEEEEEEESGEDWSSPPSQSMRTPLLNRRRRRSDMTGDCGRHCDSDVTGDGGSDQSDSEGQDDCHDQSSVMTALLRRDRTFIARQSCCAVRVRYRHYVALRQEEMEFKRLCDAQDLRSVLMQVRIYM